MTKTEVHIPTTTTQSAGDERHTRPRPPRPSWQHRSRECTQQQAPLSPFTCLSSPPFLTHPPSPSPSFRPAAARYRASCWGGSSCFLAFASCWRRALATGAACSADARHCPRTGGVDTQGASAAPCQHRRRDAAPARSAGCAGACLWCWDGRGQLGTAAAASDA